MAALEEATDYRKPWNEPRKRNIRQTAYQIRRVNNKMDVAVFGIWSGETKIVRFVVLVEEILFAKRVRLTFERKLRSSFFYRRYPPKTVYRVRIAN